MKFTREETDVKVGFIDDTVFEDETDKKLDKIIKLLESIDYHIKLSVIRK